MNYIEKIEKIIATIDVGNPIFKVNVNSHQIRINDFPWSTNLVKGYYEDLIRVNCRRDFEKGLNRYVINTQHIIACVVNEMRHNGVSLYLECAPNKEVRRTKAYKLFLATHNENSSNIEYINSMFDISEYYYNVTKTDSINKTSNDIHRKNIFQLLTLMERKYGKKTSDKRDDLTVQTNG